jgi:uncharacterized membrane protein YcaP (DUF421 family)
MFTDDPWLDAALRGLLLTATAYAWVILLTRIVGLRSLSKMTAFDFVATVATGSLLASTGKAESWPAWLQGMAVFVALFLLQAGAAFVRRHSALADRMLENEPILLMRDGEVDEAALARASITRGELIAKLREAGARRFGEVRAVVLETSGDFSVVIGDDVDPEMLEGVHRGRR